MSEYKTLKSDAGEGSWLLSLLAIGFILIVGYLLWNRIDTGKQKIQLSALEQRVEALESNNRKVTSENKLVPSTTDNSVSALSETKPTEPHILSIPDKPVVKSLDEKVAEVVKNLNATTPIVINSDVRVDSVTSIGNVIQYNATIINYDLLQLPVHFVKEVTKSAIKHVCSDSSMSELINEGVTISYDYKSRDNLGVTNVLISSETCKPSSPDYTNK